MGEENQCVAWVARNMNGSVLLYYKEPFFDRKSGFFMGKRFMPVYSPLDIDLELGQKRKVRLLFEPVFKVET